MRNKKGIITLCTTLLWLATLLCACRQPELYSEFKPVNTDGWHADDTLTFGFDISDTANLYSLLIYVRNRTDYPYQNMWMFVGGTRPDGTRYADTIEFYLADERGHWLGDGIGSLKQMPVLYQQNVRFAQPGHYTYSLRQAMRDSTLAGVSDIGMGVIEQD